MSKVAAIRRNGLDEDSLQRRGIIGSFLLGASMDHRDSLKRLLRTKSLVRGAFTLASGKKSEYYLDCKLTTLDPEGAVLTGYSILELLGSHDIRPHALGGPTVGADPIVTAVAAVSYLEGKPLPAFLVRKERKAHGRQKQIEGIEVKPGLNVVIVDEVCTTGESTMEAIAAAEETGLTVIAVVSLVDREEGGSDRLRQKYPYYPVFTAKELLEDDTSSEPEFQRPSENTLHAAPRKSTIA